jgi:GntR family transcriptional repressor for pyruvate dehydrogenase complex
MIADIRRRLFTLGSHEYQQRTQASHRAIYEAVMARNAELAKREMELHLAIVSEFTEKYPDRD